MKERWNFMPSYNWVVLRPVRMDMTEGGIAIPESAQSEFTDRPFNAEIVSIGPGRWVNGKFVETVHKPGDKVMVLVNTALVQFKLNGEDMGLIEEDRILGVATEAMVLS